MDYKDYISRIHFSFIQPTDPGLGLLTHISIPSTLDMKNTTLPFGDRESKEALAEICQVPRMSTFAIGALINRIVSDMPPAAAFVNIGVWHGFTFLAGLVNNRGKQCVGVDNFSQFSGPRQAFLQRFEKYRSENHRFYDMDYREYFSQVHRGPIGFYIYDGEHSKENQRKGLQVAEPFFAPGCLILVDDINLNSALEGTQDFMVQSTHSYRIIARQRTCHNFHPTFWNGFMLLQKID